jgi:hydroxymethylpyrimidine pyrophosphatase-like HAD family hydrolase
MRPKTIITDIDGTLIEHYGNAHEQLVREPTILPNVINKFNEWDRKGFNIILITGRRESWRKKTEQQLQELGIYYDQLIMGVGGGPRILINDLKPDSDAPTAIAINLKRNKGFDDVKI